MIRKVKTRNLLLSLCNSDDIFNCPVARHLSRNTWTNPAIEITVTIHLFAIDNGVHLTTLNDTPTYKLDRAKNTRFGRCILLSRIETETILVKFGTHVNYLPPAFHSSSLNNNLSIFQRGHNRFWLRYLIKRSSHSIHSFKCLKWRLMYFTFDLYISERGQVTRDVILFTTDRHHFTVNRIFQLLMKSGCHSTSLVNPRSYQQTTVSGLNIHHIKGYSKDLRTHLDG